MSILQKIEQLGNEKSNLCVTISMNTHRAETKIRKNGGNNPSFFRFTNI